MDKQEPEKPFTFIAHSFRKNGPKASLDTDVIFTVDQSLRPSLAFFDMIPADSTLKITVEVVS